MKASGMLAIKVRIFHQLRFSKKTILHAGYAARASALPPLPDTAGRDIGFAGGLAGFAGLAFVDGAGETIDQPHIVIVRTVHRREPRGDRRDQGGQQDRRGDDDGGEQDRR